MKNEQIFNTYLAKIDELISFQVKLLLNHLKNVFTILKDKKYNFN